MLYLVYGSITLPTSLGDHFIKSDYLDEKKTENKHLNQPLWLRQWSTESSWFQSQPIFWSETISGRFDGPLNLKKKWPEQGHQGSFDPAPVRNAGHQHAEFPGIVFRFGGGGWAPAVASCRHLGAASGAHVAALVAQLDLMGRSGPVLFQWTRVRFRVQPTSRPQSQSNPLQLQSTFVVRKLTEGRKYF